jgi:hypothetical protein
MIKFLLKAYPESLTMVTGQGRSIAGCNLLHLAMQNISDGTDGIAIVEYLCNIYPALIHMKCSLGDTPLQNAHLREGELIAEAVNILCNTDESVVRDKFTPTDITSISFQGLPLHLLIEYHSPILEVSDEGDCFRLFLQLYPASAGIKVGQRWTPYDLAVDEGLSVSFIRLLLNADPSIDPVRRHNLNYAARRNGMFLAFRALLLSQQYGLSCVMKKETC